MQRAQAGMQAGLRGSARTWRSRYYPLLGKVIGVEPKHGTVHIQLAEGNTLRNVRVIGQGTGGSRSGAQSLPQVLLRSPWTEKEGKLLLDEFERQGQRDTLAIVFFLNGSVHQPVAILQQPDFHEGSFDERNLTLDRHASDVYAGTYAGSDERHNPSQQQLQDKLGAAQGKGRPSWSGSEQQPGAWEYPRRAQQEQVFPDRRRLDHPDPVYAGKAPRFEPETEGGGGYLPLGLETYQKTGYSYDAAAEPQPAWPQKWQPQDRRDFAELPTAARLQPMPDGTLGLNRRPLGPEETATENWDADAHAWRRHTENGVEFARGWRLNQRWGSHIELNRAGDLRLLAEGLNANSHPELATEQADAGADAETATLLAGRDWGTVSIFARTEQRETAKSGWRYRRKRATAGGQLENFDDSGDETDPKDVRRFGQERLRTQRISSIVSRKDLAHGARDTASLLAGKADDPDEYKEGRWSRADPGQGGDFPRYQDRKQWRNPDSKERANLLLRSRREQLATAFGDDPPLRGEDEGGEITVISEPEKGDHSLVQAQAHAARADARFLAEATTGNVEPGADQAVAIVRALADRDDAEATVEAQAGRGTAGKDATLTLLSHAKNDGATLAATAHAGDGGDGSHAAITQTARAHDDDARIDLVAQTDTGKDAQVTATAKPAHGTALAKLLAASPDVANLVLEAFSAGYATALLQATHDVTIQSDQTFVQILGNTLIHLASQHRVVIDAPDGLEINGNVNINGTLSVNHVQVIVP